MQHQHSQLLSHTQIPENKRFSLVRRAQSFAHAGRGVWVFLRSTHNAWIHIASIILVVCAGFYVHITQVEWFALIFACGFVLSAEAFNTAIEIDIDLTSPEYHPYARDSKDVSAGAVLISACTAVIIGLIIFIPHIAPYI
jgi:diacylglycerol kinase (ATP)